MSRTVGEVAKLAHVSVRTLHHYDSIGLLVPSERSESGYRLYGEADLEKLQQVLFFRELGFALDQITQIMRDPAFDRRGALEMQRRMLADKTAQLQHMIEAVDAAIDSMERGLTMDEKDRFEVFGEFDPAEYEAEARERWGETDAYKESAHRTARYTKDDWKRIMAQQKAVTDGYVQRMEAGDAPDSPAVFEVVEKHLASITDNFYTLPGEMFGDLADMWVTDQRFTKNIDKAKPGLAQFQHDAVKAWVAAKYGK
jgi:MerR family transcriptional regulator, thiopeptide resistance regulator